MKDKILEMFFEPERWHEALNNGSLKGIKTDVLSNFMSPKGRIDLLTSITKNEYHIKRPYTAKIPKDVPGEFRTVFVNNGEDRIFLSIVNNLLFEIAGDMIHTSCMSYQKGIGCSSIVQQISKKIEHLSGKDHNAIGWKADFSKYFDSVPIERIDSAFDAIEQRFGKSCIIDIVREYYHNDAYYDTETQQELQKYQSLKQGCAVASWLANVVLYDLDQKLSDLGESYVRYSDDTLYVGSKHKEAMDIMVNELAKMNMQLNPKKVEFITNNQWVKFLGYSIKGAKISLSKNRINTFAKEITSRTIKQIRNGITLNNAIKSVNAWLYVGDNKHSWATSVLKTINVQEDIIRLNGFVLDCLRAVQVGKPTNTSGIGGLGWEMSRDGGCVSRGKGRRVRTLRNTTKPKIDGYRTLGCMRNALLFSRELYDSFVREMQ